MSAVALRSRPHRGSREWRISFTRTIAPDPTWLIGVILMLISVVAFSAAGLFTKSVAAGAWDVIFWRGAFAAACTFGFILARRTATREVWGMGRTGLIAAIVYAIGTAAFIPALKLTSVANVALIYAAAPPLAALLAWFWLRERPSTAAVLGCVLVVAGVATIVGGAEAGSGRAGDAMALVMAASFAFLMVFYRRFPGTPAAGPAALSSVILVPVALALGSPFAAPPGEIAIMAGFGIVFAIGSVAMVEGARRLAPPEAALLSTLESPLAPLLAWLVLSEVPGGATLIGGAVVVAGVLVSQRPPGR